jgi:hypothetical protein
MVQINPDGTVVDRYGGAPAGNFIALHGINFMAEDMATAVGWQLVTPTTGSNYGSGFAPLRYFIDNVGDVHLSGLVNTAGGLGNAFPILTLPVGRGLMPAASSRGPTTSAARPTDSHRC